MTQTQPRQPGEPSTNKPAPVDPITPEVAAETPVKPASKTAKEPSNG